MRGARHTLLARAAGLALLGAGLGLALAQTALAQTPPPGAAAAAQAPLKPFDEIVKGASASTGFFTLWRREDKVWLEIPEAALDKPFLLTVNYANSIGERGLYASQMGPSWLASFRRVGRQVQLIALNEKFRAQAEGGAQKLAVAQAFSPSLLASGPQASALHEKRQSFLLDASLLLADIPGLSTRLEAAFRLPYAPDRANSSIVAQRADAGLATLTARLHFATPRIPAPPLAPGAPPQQLPQTVPDPRSFFLDVVYSFAALPEQPMATRPADPRLGHFTESFTDLGGDLKANPRVHHIKRWRLEKQDPTAALSEPVKPITFWLDKNIPVKYRPVVEEAILEWNKAFEQIGFRNALVVKQQPDEADWDNMDAGHASVRWFLGADVGFNIGPSRADPRTGEIIDADIGLSDAFGRGARRLRVEDIAQSPASEARLAALTAPWRGEAAALCEDGALAAEEMAFALELLEAREDLAPDSPEVEAFVRSTLKGTMMHEVGHTLGLKHNFKASAGLSLAQLSSKAFTDAHSIANSVMEYVPVNLALKGEPQGGFHRSALGPYDYWAIEYAYKPLTPGREREELAAIAARSTEPALAYGDDADAGTGGIYDGMDPFINRFDLGDDPLAYYKKRLKLSQELWARVQARGPRADEDPLRQRRSLLAGFAQLATVAELSAKYVGGMHTLRDLPGTTGRPSFRPVEPALQRQALRFIAEGLLASDSFRFEPRFLAGLSPDYNEWGRGGLLSIPAAVARVQQAALNRLMSPATASRLLDQDAYLSPAERRLQPGLGEVYGSLQGAIWSELSRGGEIDALRRALQREHLRRLQALLTRGGGGLPAEAGALLRHHAQGLERQLAQASARGGLSVETRAHLADSLSTLRAALRATMQRA